MLYLLKNSATPSNLTLDMKTAFVNLKKSAPGNEFLMVNSYPFYILTILMSRK